LKQRPARPPRTDRYTSGTTPTSYRFTGQRKDATIGLYFYNSRYYDPLLGRFIQADTIVPNPGNPQSLNRYAYTLNNPVRYVDPSGHYSPQEIEKYLRDKYGDKWHFYWTAWRSDKVFLEMLLAAQNGDRLGAPTTGLGVGFFGAKDGSFTFTSENGLELWNYQGYGPYTLLMPNGQFRDGFSAQNTTSEHPFVGTDENISRTWEQPLYNYTEEGPQRTGFVRRTYYRYSGLSLTWNAGGVVPGLISAGFAILKRYGPRMVVGTLGGPVGELGEGALLVIDTAATVNNLININYQLQVDINDTRTYIGPDDSCSFTPCWKASP